MLVSVMLGGTKKRIQAMNTIPNATAYSLGFSQNGILTENGDEKKYYKFTLPTSGSIHLTGSAYMRWVYLYVYNADAEELWSVNPEWNSTSELITINETIYLTSGTYYFCVGRDGDRFGNYNFKIDFTSSNESFLERNNGSNNSIDLSNSIQVDGTAYNAQLAQNDGKDFWRFTLNKSGCVNFKAVFYNMEYVYWKLYDENGEELLSRNPSNNNTTTNITVDESLHLTKGVYYLSVSLDGNNYGKYTFSLPFISANETYAETNGGSNNIISNASSITLGKTYIGQIALNDNKDFYKFTLPSARTLTVSVQSPVEYIYITIFDSQGEELWSTEPYRSSTTQIISYSKALVFEKGTYYLAIEKSVGYGNYLLEISQLTQANCPHEDCDYTVHDATYFKKGYTQYTCKVCGYTYKTDYRPVQKLSQAYFYSYCYTKKNKMYLFWTSVYNATGYQIRYSKNRMFKSGVTQKSVRGTYVTKKIISKLSRKQKYYVQIRAYKKQGGKIAYGQWSKKKCLKTK